ncbi:MAG: FUN14 domain-containing protein, partial [Candidatus Nitrosopolaris sp.]
MVVDISSLTSTATSVGFGGVTGFLIGYAIKKVVKILLVIVGLVFVAFVFLEYQKIITVNWNKIQANTIAALGNVTSGQLLASSGIPGTDHIGSTMT